MLREGTQRGEKCAALHTECGKFLLNTLAVATRALREREREGSGDEIGARPNFGGLLILAPRPFSMSHVRLVSVRRVGTLEIAHTHARVRSYCTPTSRYSRATIDDLDVRVMRIGRTDSK